MPRWQRGHASGCRPVDGSSKTGLSDKKMTEIEIVNLPRGSKILFMLSFGIDSPVAYKLLSRKFNVEPIHFLTTEFHPPGTTDIVIENLKKLKENLKFEKLYVAEFSEVLYEITEKVKRKYVCLICRRSMLKIAEEFAVRNGFVALGTGESLAQKASQTIYNFSAIHTGFSLPILTPLLGLDKEEIVELSKKFGLYMEKHVGKCEAAPKYPVTMSNYSRVKRFFEKIDNDVLEGVLKNIKPIYDPEEIREVALV